MEDSVFILPNFNSLCDGNFRQRKVRKAYREPLSVVSRHREGILRGIYSGISSLALVVRSCLTGFDISQYSSLYLYHALN